MKLIQYIKNPLMFLVKIDNLGLIRLSDKMYLEIVYKYRTKTKLNLKKPETFNEKLQWLKLYDRKESYSNMVDKYEVKEYIKKTIGEEYLIPNYGVYNSFEEIDFEKLPEQFVIKCTHDSGGLVIVKDKEKFDIKDAKNKIEKSLNRNYYIHGREWPYKNVKPRIIVEKYMEDESKYELKDYKVFCFNGIPKMIMVDSGRFVNHKRNVYDTNWNKLDINLNFPSCEMNFQKPKYLEKILELSKILSDSIPFIRVDFYIINDRIYFGELTFFPGSGFQKIEPEIWQKRLGDWIELPN